MDGRMTKSGLSKEAEDRLYRQLIQLGDMMGDGQHLEPGGKWISRDYKKVAKALGLLELTPEQKTAKKAINADRRAAIDERMVQRVREFSCRKCGGEVKQTRKGSKRAQCTQCEAKWQLLK